MKATEQARREELRSALRDVVAYKSIEIHEESGQGERLDGFFEAWRTIEGALVPTTNVIDFRTWRAARGR